MKHIITLLLASFAVGCAEYPTQNVVVTHRLELEQIGNEIERLCREANSAEVEVNDCVQDVLDNLLTSLAEGGAE